ncbi:Cytochrome P450 71D10 [Hibiscus syriacus]|uniref:Cytochrome P450 71D10 n=1 Tax=Hibiscus syriacus TaxID=106335 RepID=A0A6A2YLR4_HIBSY|nr:Cytochrome P450 71D10 [Hibiscus syriacus]
MHRIQLGEHVVVSSAEDANEVLKKHDIHFSNKPFSIIWMAMLLQATSGSLHIGAVNYETYNLSDQAEKSRSIMDNQFHFLPLSFTFLVFIFMVFKLRARSKVKDSREKLPPAPWKLPLIGQLHHLVFSLPHLRLTELAKRHGPVMHLQLGGLSLVVVSSPDAAREVLKTHDINFANRTSLLFAEIIWYNYTDIVFAPYGGYWRQLRKVCTLELLSTKRVQSFRSIREDQVSSLIRSILSNAGSEINIGEMLCNSSYNITSRSSFGGRCKQHETFISTVKEVLDVVHIFSISDLFPSVKLLPVISGKRAKLERFHHDLDVMLESIIEEHRVSNANPNNSDDVTEDFLDVLLNLQDHGSLEFPLTTDNIKAVLLDMLIGGTETSSTTVEWAMSEMMKNPRTLEKAQAEVRRVYDRTGDVNESDLHRLKYLKLVIKETLRLHPPISFLVPRENTERCEINGYEIPAKTKVVVNIWAIGRDPNYWNEADKFKPERFIDSAVDYKGSNFEFIPFSAGRRMCPGISYGMAVVELSLAQLLYNFDWKLPNGMKNEDLDMAEAFGLTVRRKRDLHLIPIPYQPPPCVQ